VKKIVILIVLACLGLLGWQIYSRVTTATGRPSARPIPSVPVEVAAVIRNASIQDIGRFTGSLLPASQFVVAPKTGGRVDRILVDIGDSVESGELIALLEDAEHAQQVDQARAELEVAKANVAECRSALDVARRQYDRDVALRDKKIASEAELDEAEARFKASEAKHQVALAQVAQNEAALKVAQVRLSYTRVDATWEDDGTRVVGERFVDEGAMLKANDPIVSVLEIDTLKAVIFITERDYPKVHPGQEVRVTTDAYPGRVFGGRVTRVAPLLKEASRQARIEIAVPNEEHLLKPGMFIRARIEFEEHVGVTVIPMSALVRRGGEQGVFIADMQQMRVRFAPVSLGIVEGEHAEVIDGPLVSGSGQPADIVAVAPGANEAPRVWIVTLGQHLLEDGSAINLPEKTLAPGQPPPGKVEPEDVPQPGSATGDAK